MEKLYELSRGILVIDLHHPPGPQLAQLIYRIYAADDIAIFDANLARLDHLEEWSSEQQQMAKMAYLLDKNDEDQECRTIQRLIRIDTTTIGALAIRGEVSPMIANAIASLAAIAFERCRSYENETRAESAQQSEQMRVAVLDALAHAFKTPLTAIRAASSGLLEMGTLDKTEAELAALIDEESVNLNNLCTRLLQTAKLEASSVTLRTEPVIVSKLVKDAGADDYITKPFQLRELTARMRAAMRWAKMENTQEDPVLHINKIELDPTRRTVKKGGRLIHLTPKKFELTHHLMIHAGRPIQHSRLLNAVWGEGYGNGLEYWRTFMRQLRKKLEDDPANPRYLLTESHVGYRFAKNCNSQSAPKIAL